MDTDLESVKQSIGLMPQEVNLSIFEKCIDIVTTVGGYYGVPYSIARPRAEKILTELGLGDKMESIARTLSGGMKRRLMLARALIHEPKLLILDEPTAGVDVALRRGMWEYLQKLQRETGMTILLTTHYLEEVEALCEHVTILDHGRVIISDSVKNTLKKLEKETYLIEVESEVLSDFPGFVSYEAGNLTVIIDAKNTLESVFAKLSEI
jgi:ABC-2 type transport system ATP-binding protein